MHNEMEAQDVKPVTYPQLQKIFFIYQLLTMSDSSGYHMSQMLYLYGEWDPRVRPLVFAVRRWALDRHITSPFAGRWITNFSLTLLVLFYLINVQVIPSLSTLGIIAASE